MLARHVDRELRMLMLDREPGPSEVDLVETTSCGAVQSVIKQLARAPIQYHIKLPDSFHNPGMPRRCGL